MSSKNPTKQEPESSPLISTTTAQIHKRKILVSNLKNTAQLKGISLDDIVLNLERQAHDYREALTAYQDEQEQRYPRIPIRTRLQSARHSVSSSAANPPHPPQSYKIPPRGINPIDIATGRALEYPQSDRLPSYSEAIATRNTSPATPSRSAPTSIDSNNAKPNNHRSNNPRPSSRLRRLHLRRRSPT